MDEQNNENSNEAASDPLALWLALELRRAHAAFDKSRKEQDSDCEAKGLRKSGVRVKLTIKSASEICVALADDTIAKAIEFQSPPLSFADARAKVETFTKEVTLTAIPLAFVVSGETGFGGSVVKAATERGTQLCVDVAGAFALAVRSGNERRAVRSLEEIKQSRDIAELLGTTFSITSFLAKQPTKNSAIEGLFDHWRREACRDYEAARDAVSDEFTLAGRAQSGYHIRGLSEAAECSVCAMLSKARALPITPENYATALANGLALFDDLAVDVRAVAVGASGRMPTPANGVLADRISSEGRAHIMAQVNKWSLEDQLKVSVSSPTATANQNLSQRAPAVKLGYPPNDAKILAKAEEMKALGLDGRTIAKQMRHEDGFENVTTTAVRDLIKGIWKPAGRPKRKRAL